MLWARMLAYITGTVDQELLPRNSCSEPVRLTGRKLNDALTPVAKSKCTNEDKSPRMVTAAASKLIHEGAP
jgi:hypothetical protein